MWWDIVKVVVVAAAACVLLLPVPFLLVLDWFRDRAEARAVRHPASAAPGFELVAAAKDGGRQDA